jgi:hypothetical protein
MKDRLARFGALAKLDVLETFQAAEGDRGAMSGER